MLDAVPLAAPQSAALWQLTLRPLRGVAMPVARSKDATMLHSKKNWRFEE
jgi:hypothetical protein